MGDWNELGMALRRCLQEADNFSRVHRLHTMVILHSALCTRVKSITYTAVYFPPYFHEHAFQNYHMLEN